MTKEEGRIMTPDLICRLRDGSQDAFKTIYLHYYGSISKFLFSLLRSKEEAEEIAQDVFMTLWEKRERLDPSHSIRSYIYTIARNAALNLFDRRKVLDRFSQMGHVPAYDDITSEDILIARETELLVKLVVQRMPKMRRQIFELNRYEDMDNTAIAEKLGISKANVANHLALARKDIRDVIITFLLFMMP